MRKRKKEARTSKQKENYKRIKHLSTKQYVTQTEQIKLHKTVRVNENALLSTFNLQ